MMKKHHRSTTPLRAAGVSRSFGQALRWTTVLLLLPNALASATARDYEQMQAAELTPAQPIGSEGLQWRTADARFFLDAGNLRWLRPSGGESTGVVFEGEGRFQLPVQHVAELRQLRRFADEPNLEGVSIEFDAMTLRGSGLAALLGFESDPTEGSSFSRVDSFRDSMENWLRHTRTDADARVVAAQHNAGDRYLQAEFSSKQYGTVYFVYDESRLEELSFVRIKNGFPEQWVSLDRPDERLPDGTPNSDWTDEFIQLTAIDVAVDVTEPGKGGARGVGSVNPVRAKYETAATFRAKLDGVGALRLRLSPLAVVSSVASGGQPLEFLRYHIGGLSRSISNDIYDGSLVVLLEEPLGAGEMITIDVAYEMEMGNFASLLSWYPNPVDAGFEDLHAVKVAITHRKDYEVRAMGELIQQTSEGRTVTSVWQTPEPVDAAAFTIARLPYEKSYEFDGLPEILMFGTRAGSMSSDKIEQYAPDVINAVNFLQNLFGTKISAEKLYVTYIAAGHGQAGTGFIHISDGIAQYFGGASIGRREAFLAHEVAHEWWGHQLSWASYRDQWLSEGFAEYASLLFIEASLDNGDRVFKDMVRTRHDQVSSSLKRSRDRMGPIGHGLRAGTAEHPGAYFSMTYTKGALVLHSVRSILKTLTKNDDAFFRVLRDFVGTHQGGAVRTSDFIAVLQKHAPSPYWPVFFDQFVYSNDMPEISYAHKAERSGNQWKLVLEVEQSEVPEGFRTAVPLRVDFGKDRTGEMLLVIDEPKKRFELDMPAKPGKVTLNPDHAVLAQVKRR